MKNDEIGRVYVVILKSKEKTCNFAGDTSGPGQKLISYVSLVRRKERGDILKSLNRSCVGTAYVIVSGPVLRLLSRHLVLYKS
jgi:hypothetical protein